MRDLARKVDNVDKIFQMKGRILETGNIISKIERMAKEKIEED